MPDRPEPVPDLDWSPEQARQRACIVNFRTEAEHLELLLEAAAEHGERLSR